MPLCGQNKQKNHEDIPLSIHNGYTAMVTFVVKFNYATEKIQTLRFFFTRFNVLFNFSKILKKGFCPQC